MEVKFFFVVIIFFGTFATGLAIVKQLKKRTYFQQD